MGYCYSEGPESGSTAAMQHNSTLGVIEEGSPGTTTWGRPTVPRLLTTQLSDIAAVFTASTPVGTYTLTWASGTNRITLTSTNLTTHRPALVGNIANWLGFTQVLAGWATSWVGADAPQACAKLLGVTVEPAEDWAQVDFTRYRHGRVASIGWGNHQAHEIRLYFAGENIALIQAGYLTAGRVRIHQVETDPDPYSPTHPGGYVDGWVVAASEPTEEGDTGDLWSLRMVVAVPR